VLSCVLEAIQTLMPTRTPDVTDVMLAVAGAAVGAMLRQARPRATPDAAALDADFARAPGALDPG
jgi:VanZ family protein